MMNDCMIPTTYGFYCSNFTSNYNYKLVKSSISNLRYRIIDESNFDSTVTECIVTRNATELFSFAFVCQWVNSWPRFANNSRTCSLLIVSFVRASGKRS